MNWEAFGALGEIVGALAVVGTLGYLAIQIRQSSQVELAKSEREIMDSWSQIMMAWWGNPEVADIAIRGLTGEKLSRNEKGTFFGLLTMVITHYSSCLRMHEKGLIHEGTLSIFSGSVVSLLRSPGAGQWWSTVGPAYFDSEHIDSLLSDDKNDVHDWTLYFSDEANENIDDVGNSA